MLIRKTTVNRNIRGYAREEDAAQILLDESKIRHVCAPIEKYYSIRTTQWGPTDGG